MKKLISSGGYYIYGWSKLFLSNLLTNTNMINLYLLKAFFQSEQTAWAERYTKILESKINNFSSFLYKIRLNKKMLQEKKFMCQTAGGRHGQNSINTEFIFLAYLIRKSINKNLIMFFI